MLFSVRKNFRREGVQVQGAHFVHVIVVTNPFSDIFFPKEQIFCILNQKH